MIDDVNDEVTDDVLHPIPFITSKGEQYLIDWRDIEILQQRDPDGRTLPSFDVNELVLTADDYAWLWSQGIGA